MNPSIRDDLFKELRKQTLESESKRRVNLYPFWPTRVNISEKLTIFWKISNNYELKHKWAVEQQFKIFTSLNVLSSYVVSNQIRKSFNLIRGNYAAFSTLAPVFIFTTTVGAALHLSLVFGKIISNPLEEPYKVMVQSSAIHLTTSVMYPILFTTGSSMFFASKYNTLPIPDDMGLSRQSRKYIYDNIIRKMFKRYRKSWLLLSGFNLLAAGFLTWMECDQIKMIFLSELAKHSMDGTDQTSHQ